MEEGNVRPFVGTNAGFQGISGPIVKLINSTIQEALKQDATDIHFEPEEKLIRVRYRIDGILHNQHTIDLKLLPALATRLKVMAGLKLTESRVPQSGSTKFVIGERMIDLRVLTVPGLNGESIVVRLLDRDRLILRLEDLGFSEQNLKTLLHAISLPNGIILVTGPTGSGKTTTLYAALMHLSGSDKKIITLEDPVEYELPGIRQSQISPKAGLTFAEGLKAVLREDPDVVMLSEMHDADTVEIAIRAALTGHLVLSTLHTNDAVGAITRLQDMEVAPYLISSSVILVIAQRLVRLICPRCENQGCEQCFYTGFKGRTLISEALLMDEDMRSKIIQSAAREILLRQAVDSGMRPMRLDGLEKVHQGLTTEEEVDRVIHQT